MKIGVKTGAGLVARGTTATVAAATATTTTVAAAAAAAVTAASAATTAVAAAATAAVAAAAATAVAAAAAAVATAAAAAAAAFFAGTRFVDRQGTALDGFAVELGDRVGRVLSVDMVTKPKPRDLPVTRSCMSRTSVTGPTVANRSWRSFSVVLNDRLPT